MARESRKWKVDIDGTDALRSALLLSGSSVATARQTVESIACLNWWCSAVHYLNRTHSMDVLGERMWQMIV